MGKARSALGQYFIDNAHLSNEELRAKVAETFPDADMGRNFFNYRRRAAEALKKLQQKKPGPKPGKKKAKGARLPAEPVDLLETPDAKQLTALVMRVGLNTAEQVMARLKHIEERTSNR